MKSLQPLSMLELLQKPLMAEISSGKYKCLSGLLQKASLELFANKWSDTDSWEPLFLFYCYKLFRFKRCVYSIFKFELFVPTYVKTFILTNSQL